ncbi:MAG TPA: hypothetical protein VIJ22_08395 [Polyangiaceae bacterium]
MRRLPFAPAAAPESASESAPESGQLPGKGDFEVIDIYLRPGVTDDPRIE